MTVLSSRVDADAEEFVANRTALLGLIAELDAQNLVSIAGGGERATARHHGRGRLLARERIELLLDPDTAFLELSSLAAWGTDFALGASIITGVGVIEGVECMIIAHDPTVRGGTMNPITLRKNLRALEIARVNRLPLMYLVESGGADLPTQADLFIPAGRIFHEITALSAAGVPSVSLVFGNSTAGGAYVPGMSDYAVLVDKQAQVFLGGPPLVKMATGEDAEGESLGGAAMHTRVSGLGDYFAVDERDALRIGRRIVARLNWRKAGPAPASHPRPPRYPAEELLGIVSADQRIPFDPRDVIARIVDDSDFDEYKALYATSLVTGWASIHGYPVGIIANHRGVLFGEEAEKATEFILLANQTDTSLIFLQNTTGYMVGQEYEQAGIIKDGAKMVNAVSNSTVPHITINMAASFGAGQLRDVGARVRPAIRLQLAEYAPGGHGRGPARRGHVDRGQSVRRGRWPLVRRGGGCRAASHDRGADRRGIHRLLHVGQDLRRRDHRPAGHARRARDRALRGALGAGDRAPRLRRLQDVTRR